MEIKKTQNAKGKKQNFGFTLVEILVVVGILGLIVVVASTIFFTTSKSSSKTKALTTVKQNGDYALSVMERLIRDSEEVITNSDNKVCESGMKKIKLKRIDGTTVEFACSGEGTANGQIASNSARLTSDEVKVDSCSFDCSCPTAYPNCTGEGAKFYPKTVTIKFTLSQFGATVRPEEQATLNFQTTITTRNY
jgi:prepilin-type N-terminal cleavage/methylation domain-containing protein